MGLIRGKGESLSDAKARMGGKTLHGSIPKREMAKWGGAINRRGQLPNGKKRP